MSVIYKQGGDSAQPQQIVQGSLRLCRDYIARMIRDYRNAGWRCEARGADWRFENPQGAFCFTLTLEGTV